MINLQILRCPIFKGIIGISKAIDYLRVFFRLRVRLAWCIQATLVHDRVRVQPHPIAQKRGEPTANQQIRPLKLQQELIQTRKIGNTSNKMDIDTTRVERPLDVIRFGQVWHVMFSQPVTLHHTVRPRIAHEVRCSHQFYQFVHPIFSEWPHPQSF